MPVHRALTSMDSSQTRVWSRRGLLAGAGAVIVAAGVAAQRWLGRPDSNALQPEVAALFDGLDPGTHLGRWTLQSVHPVTLGAVPVVMSTSDGHRFQVDVLARDPNGPAGVANTEHLSLFVQNHGDGSTRTDEEQGLGAMALAEALRRREGAGAELPDLLTLQQRHRQHPDGSFGVPTS